MKQTPRLLIMLTFSVVALLGTSLGTGIAQAQDADGRAAIEKVIASYVAAFNARDAKALAAHWSPEAVYLSRQNGQEISGRDALEKEFAAQFENLKGAQIKVTTESIDFVSPNVALERGRASVTMPDAEPSNSSYRVVHVKRDGKWLIDRVSEEEDATPPPTHYGQLKELDWMTGSWIDQAGGDVIKTQCHWTRNKNYLMRAFTATVGDRVDLTGMQFIGWDSARKQIRSWVFDSDGGFSEGVWAKKDNYWLVQTKATLPDGSLASSTTILKPLGKDRFTWQQVNRVVAGEILPNLDSVVIVREE